MWQDVFLDTWPGRPTSLRLVSVRGENATMCLSEIVPIHIPGKLGYSSLTYQRFLLFWPWLSRTLVRNPNLILSANDNIFISLVSHEERRFLQIVKHWSSAYIFPKIRRGGIHLGGTNMMPEDFNKCRPSFPCSILYFRTSRHHGR
jgi:hypothetical protein